jgi:hypothetical protein
MSKINNSSNRPKIQQPKPQPPKIESKPAEAKKSTTPANNSFETKNETKGGLFSSLKSIARKFTAGNSTVESKYDKSTFGPNSKTTTSIKTSDAQGNEKSSSKVLINGRLQSTSTASTSVNGDLSQTTKTDKTFGRDGQVSSQTLTQSMEQKYKFGENHTAKITTENSNTRSSVGNFKSESVSYQSENGRFGREDKVTSQEGKKLTTSHDVDPKLKGTTLTLESRGVEYKDTQFDKTKTTERTFDTRPNSRGTTDEEKAAYDKKLAGQKKTSENIRNAGEILEAAGLKHTLVEKKETVTEFNPNSKLAEKELGKDENGVGYRVDVGRVHRTQTQGEVTIGASGLKASAGDKIEASVFSASSEGRAKGALGEASYKADVKVLAAEAGYNGKAQIGPTGATVEGGANVKLTAISVNAEGKYETPPVTIGGVELGKGSVEAKVNAEVSAEAKATGKVGVELWPPKAIAEGEVGASAVAKAEGEVAVGFGPFKVKGTGYVSAGAEAKASGVIGFEDGKLKIGGGVGAALGVGAGANVQVEVDVGQIAKTTVDAGKKVARAALDNTAVGQEINKRLDVTGDGKFGTDDLKVVGKQALDTGKQVASAAVDKGKAVINNVGQGLSSAASSVKNAFSGW